MLQIADTPKQTREEILRADVDSHLRQIQQGLCTLRLLLKAMEQNNPACYLHALGFTIDAIDQPVEAIEDLIDRACERSGEMAALDPAANAARGPASPGIVTLIHRLNEAVLRGDQNGKKLATSLAAQERVRGVELGCSEEAICAERSDIERQILEFPIASIGDLVILAKVAEHQLNYGQIADGLPIALVDAILRIFAGRSLNQLGRPADLPISI
jgi:hypothetical protein